MCAANYMPGIKPIISNSNLETLSNKLQPLIEHMDWNNITSESAYQILLACVLMLPILSIPKCSFNPYTKPYWNASLKIAHDVEKKVKFTWQLRTR